MMLFVSVLRLFWLALNARCGSPIRNMVNTVDPHPSGNSTAVEGFMLGELDMLKNGINSMAMSLAAYHEDAAQYRPATSDLRDETLEQMEIQNVELDLAKSAPGKRRVLNPSFWQICHTSCVHH